MGGGDVKSFLKARVALPEPRKSKNVNQTLCSLTPWQPSSSHCMLLATEAETAAQLMVTSRWPQNMQGKQNVTQTDDKKASPYTNTLKQYDSKNTAYL